MFSASSAIKSGSDDTGEAESIKTSVIEAAEQEKLSGKKFLTVSY